MTDDLNEDLRRRRRADLLTLDRIDALRSGRMGYYDTSAGGAGVDHRDVAIACEERLLAANAVYYAEFETPAPPLD